MSEKNNIKALKIKNGHLERIINFLDAPLHGIEARARNRFVSSIGEQIVFMNKERQKSLEEHCEKDKEGKPILLDKGTRYDITQEGLQKVNKELATLYEEEFIIDILPSNEVEIAIVKRLLLETKKEFNLVEGAIYDELCKVFELIE